MGQASTRVTGPGGTTTWTATTVTGSVGTEATTPEERTAEIRGEIAQTRAEMSQTIDALQERLNPAALKEQAQEKLESVKAHAKETVREATIGRVEHMAHDARDSVRDAGYTMMDTVRENPLPAALAAIGLGWLFMKSRETTSYRASGARYREDRRIGYARSPSPFYDKALARGSVADEPDGGLGEKLQGARQGATDAAANVKERAGEIADHTRERVGEMAHQVQDRAHELAHRAQYQARRAESQFDRTLDENPLAIGAVALALGAAAGLAIPRTRREDELMGQVRDQLMDKAQGLAHETMEKVQHVTEKVVDEATHTAKQEARSQGLSH